MTKKRNKDYSIVDSERRIVGSVAVKCGLMIFTKEPHLAASPDKVMEDEGSFSNRIYANTGSVSVLEMNVAL
ncbi:hypothetical protein FQA39_LY14512 [Lamprigera yunnana]|nr:hypothetical protein FQA39_LY14512 [Lamprigera yunnana]